MISEVARARLRLRQHSFRQIFRCMPWSVKRQPGIDAAEYREISFEKRCSCCRGGSGFHAAAASTDACICQCGSGGNLKQILEVVWQKNPLARVAINAISLETIAEVTAFLQEHREDVESESHPDAGEPGKTGGSVSSDAGRKSGDDFYIKEVSMRKRGVPGCAGEWKRKDDHYLCAFGSIEKKKYSEYGVLRADRIISIRCFIRE